eukprot:4089710-Prorocentrum_lima.AAC.1
MSAGAQPPSLCIRASLPWLHPLRRGTPRRPCLARPLRTTFPTAPGPWHWPTPRPVRSAS